MQLQDAETKTGAQLLQHLLEPCCITTFFRNVWEKRSLLVQRQNGLGFYRSWFSKALLKNVLDKGDMKYGVNVDVTHYDGEVSYCMCKDAFAKQGDALADTCQALEVNMVNAVTGFRAGMSAANSNLCCCAGTQGLQLQRGSGFHK
jgi:hypothetical protein